MNRNVSAIIFTSIFIMLFSTPAVFSNLIFAQSSVTDESSNPTSLESAPLLEKIKGASSLSSIQAISWVDGIEVTGVNVGENQATVTLNQVGGEESDSNRSKPVTVVVIRTPGSSIKNLMALVEASNKLTGKNTTNPLIGMIGQMGGLGSGVPGENMSSLGGLAGLNVSEQIKPLQALLQLGKDTKIGVGNIVGGDWEKPRSITTGISTLGGLLGLEGGSTTESRVQLSMVLVVPFSGKTSFGTVEFQ
jgi:hypothetical protein